MDDNHLFGDIPESIGYLEVLTTLHLRNDFLSGKLPMSLGNCSYLEILDVSENNLSGSISPIMTNTLIKVLSLRKNSFSGEIPHNISRMSQLQVFDVSRNKFWGRIPPFQGMVKGGISLVYRGDIDGKQYYNEEVTLLIKGNDLEYGRILYLVTAIDLSNNHFEGEIPEGLMKYSELMFLNMSHNRLMGKIPQNIGVLQSLESLDLSNNQLTGEIPPSLSRLTSLAMLNFSDNRLQGRIPSGPQLDTFNGSSFANNLDLCGPQIEKQCPQDAKVQLPNGQSNGYTITHIWFYMGILSGFVVGFWGVFGTFILRRDIRFAFFNFFDWI